MPALSLTQKWLKQNVAQYPDQDRVYLDVDTVLARYSTLRPKSDVYTYDDGRTQLLLCVHGLLGITYRNSSYNIPVAIWITREYPRQSPIAYVVPTADMLVRADRYVDPSGRCQTEYMQAWERKSEGCTLLGLIESMQQDFSQRPPLYAKPKNQPPPSTSSTPGGSERLQSPALPPKPGASTADPRSISAVQSPASLATRPPPPLPQEPRQEYPSQQQRSAQPPYPRQYTQQQHSEQPLPYVAPIQTFHPQYTGHPPAASTSPPGWSQAQTPAYSPPPARPPPPPFIPNPTPVSPPAPPPQPIHDFLDSDDEISTTQSLPRPTHAPPRPPNPEMLRLHAQVHDKIRTELASLSSALALDAERLRAQQSDLLAAEPAIRDEMGRLEAVRDICRNVAGRTRQVVDAAQRNVDELKRKGDPEVDELVCATTIVHNQLINLIAEDNAIEDTIYHLHRALSAGRIDLERFLRTSRSLAEEQFMKRALIQKIWAGLPGSSI